MSLNAEGRLIRLQKAFAGVQIVSIFFKVFKAESASLLLIIVCLT